MWFREPFEVTRHIFCTNALAHTVTHFWAGFLFLQSVAGFQYHDIRKSVRLLVDFLPWYACSPLSTYLVSHVLVGCQVSPWSTCCFTSDAGTPITHTYYRRLGGAQKRSGSEGENPSSAGNRIPFSQLDINSWTIRIVRAPSPHILYPVNLKYYSGTLRSCYCCPITKFQQIFKLGSAEWSKRNNFFPV